MTHSFKTDKRPHKNFKAELHRFSPLNNRASKNLKNTVPQQTAQLGKDLTKRDLCYGLSNEVTQM